MFIISGAPEYTSRVAGLSIGILICILVPVSVLIICIGYKIIRRQNLEKRRKELEF